MKIAICDDEIGTCGEIENMLLTFAKSHALQIDTEVFYTGESLCAAMRQGCGFDLAFLDVQLLQMDGVQVGRQIREQMKNEKISIVYISGKESYAMRLFRVRPLDFLIKPITEKDVAEMMEKFLYLTKAAGGFFTFPAGKTVERVPFDEILYFACNGKKIEIHTRAGAKSFYGSMREVQQQTDGNGFWVLHKSFIVNAAFVAVYRYDSVQLTDGTGLPISRRYRCAMKENLAQAYRKG